jgi:hypothetical protein
MIPVHHPVQIQIVLQVVRTVTEIPVRHHDRVPIVPIVVQVQIDHVAKTHTVAIARVQVMTAIRVRLRVTANVADVLIVPEVVSPMIAKNVHAVALAKSA